MDNVNYTLYRSRIGSNQAATFLSKLGQKESNRFDVEDKCLYYKIKAGDFAFYKSGQDADEEILAVSSEFLCLCAYTSSVTGKLVHLLLPPEDVMPTI